MFSYSGKLLVQLGTTPNGTHTSDTPTIGTHLMHCETLKKMRDVEKYQVEVGGVWNIDSNHMPLQQVPLRDADFNRS